jgi:hypothetical protein
MERAADAGMILRVHVDHQHYFLISAIKDPETGQQKLIADRCWGCDEHAKLPYGSWN